MNPSNQTTSALRLLENKIPPPMLVILIGLAMWPASLLAPAIVISRDLSLLLAGIFGLFGFSLLASGFLAFREAKTTIKRVRLISLTKGGLDILPDAIKLWKSAQQHITSDLGSAAVADLNRHLDLAFSQVSR